MKNRHLIQSSSRICAVVVTYNRKTLLEECLSALQNQTRPLDEIIVIDNASTDGTDAFVKAQFAGVTYVKLSKNTGGAGGFHEGMKLAFEKGHDWIWVMDDDSIATPDALEKLAGVQIINGDQICAVASAVVNTGGDIYLGTRRLLNNCSLTEWAFELHKHSAPSENYAKAYFEIDTASFVGLLVSRSTVKEVGFPEKKFFIYWDDVEYSLRIRRLGKILTVPDSKILHEIPSPLSKPSKKRIYYFHRNRILTCRRHDDLNLTFYWRALVSILRTIRLLAVRDVQHYIIRLKSRAGLKSSIK